MPIQGFVVTLFLMSFLSISNAKMSNKIGIAYGRLGNNLPSPEASIQLIQSINASRVKLYDANPEILQLLSGSKIQVSIMIPNEEISPISTNQNYSDLWVQHNIIPYYPKTMIRFLLVGNEILSYSTDQDRQLWFDLVPAMKNLRRSLKKYDLLKIKIGTPLAMDAIESSFPPSSGTFRSDVTVPVMKPLLQFLNRTKSFFFLDVYPYFPWSENPRDINLDYALLNENNYTYVDPVSGLSYTNLLDQMLDSVVFAMTKLGFRNVRLYIAETGWPSAGDIDQVGANVYNAATYNRNLVERIIGARTTIGTPARPIWGIPTFIFSLFNENQKPGPGTERNWGVMYPDGRPIYEIDLTGSKQQSDYQALPKGNNNAPYEGKIWCVVANEARNLTNELVSAITYACGQGNGTCDLIHPGRECYQPISVVSHANFAFSSFWSQLRSSGASCSFNGLAIQTSRDPSHGSCKVPGVAL
ncbi:hypothetical protein MKX03_036824 [Papaver bracteatum]|nr:hypothetical protein MKX03_036824 [Papaver bracteatum]